MLLSLEQVAVMTEIRKELDFNGFCCLVKVNGKVDIKLSVFEVLNHINAVFPNLEVPFGYIFVSVLNYVLEWEEHLEKIYKKN